MLHYCKNLTVPLQRGFAVALGYSGNLLLPPIDLMFIMGMKFDPENKL